MSKSKVSHNKEFAEDTSPKIFQNSKLKHEVEIKERFKLTEKQNQIIESILDNNNVLTIIDGPAGSGKTYVAAIAMLKLLNSKKISEFNYFRSLVQSRDSETGFLPGTLEERCQYYFVPLYDQLSQLLTKTDLNQLVKDNKIKASPTSMLRGVNLYVEGAILDECQNCTFDTLFTVATRIGFKSRLVMLGDSENQNDLGKSSGFLKFCHMFSTEECLKYGINYLKLTEDDIVRSEFVKFIVKRFKEYTNGIK